MSNRSTRIVRLNMDNVELIEPRVIKQRTKSRVVQVPMSDKPLELCSILNDRSGNAIFLGVDIGLANCGYAFVKGTPDNPIVIDSGVISTTSEDSLEYRIQQIYKKMKEKIDVYNPVKMVLERLFHNAPSHSMGKSGRVRNKSASILYTNMVSGIMLLLSAEKQMAWEDMVVGSWKKAYISKGNASKEEVKDVSLVLAGKEKMMNDESDAIGIAVAALKKYFEEGGYIVV